MAPSTDWKEVIPAGEAEKHEGFAQVLNDLQKRHAEKNPLARGLHAKGQAGAEATLTIHPNLPPHAAQGIAAKPATYRALVRYSNGGPVRVGDKKPDVRGIAVKAIGVEGKKLIPGMEDETTQDFLAILGDSTPFVTPDDFVWFVVAARSPATLPLKVLGHFGFGRGIAMIKALVKSASRKTFSVATSKYGSQLPIKWGPYAVRYAFDPIAKDDAAAALGTTHNYLGDELVARLAKSPVEYDFKVQFFVDEQKTPIEDGSVEWKEGDAPWVTVGRLTIPAQDALKVGELIESLSFDPWHALAEHRPLGSMMRARSPAYRLSTQERKAAKEPR